MTLTTTQLNQLVENYAEKVVDDMDIKCLIQMAYDTIVDNMSHMNEEDVLNEISNVYDEDLIEELIAEVVS